MDPLSPVLTHAGQAPPCLCAEGPVGYLEVKVCNALRVQIVDTVQDLLEELGGLVFGQRLFLGQEVEELAA